jgi:transposase
MDLTDDQLSIIQPLIPDPPRRPDGKGRPWKNPLDVMNGVLLWIQLRTGACWYDMPDRYVPLTVPNMPSQISTVGTYWSI